MTILGCLSTLVWAKRFLLNTSLPVVQYEELIFVHVGYSIFIICQRNMAKGKWQNNVLSSLYGPLVAALNALAAYLPIGVNLLSMLIILHNLIMLQKNCVVSTSNNLPMSWCLGHSKPAHHFCLPSFLLFLRQYSIYYCTQYELQHTSV